MFQLPLLALRPKITILIQKSQSVTFLTNGVLDEHHIFWASAFIVLSNNK